MPAPGATPSSPCRTSSRQSIYSRLAGYEDTNDAERVAENPTFRMLASRARRETSVALTSTLHWFKTEASRGRAELSRHGRARAGDLQQPLRVRLLSSLLRLHPDRRLPA